MNGSLGNLAAILVFVILFFVLLTQRMMIDNPLDQRHTQRPIPLIIEPMKTVEPIHIPDPIVVDHIVPTKNPTALPINGNIRFLDNPTAKTTSIPTTAHGLHFDIVHNHPFQSPRNGTDISLPKQTGLLLCPNQSKCIVPELQLQKKFKIYLCSHPVRQGVRFYYLAREGLLLHPNVELLDRPDMLQADYFVYLPGSAPWHLSECNDTTLAPRMIVLDEFDGHTLVAPTLNSTNFLKAYGKVDAVWYFMYFKRSFVRRIDGVFKGYPHLVKPDAYPMTYAVAEAYIQHHFNSKREIEISCTLRGSKEMTTRQRVQDWIAEYGKARAIPKERMITGEVDTLQRNKISNQYFQQMYNSRIIVTVNPANWEGDFRLWEAMGSGALIFVDPIFVPHQFPLQDGEHVIYFSNHNKTDLFAKLDFYRSHPEHARQIANNGYLFAMKHHRTVNLVDYILRSTHLKEARLRKEVPLPRYSYTGQYLNQEAKLQEERVRACHSPGIFEDPARPGYNATLALAKKIKCSKKTRSPGSNIAFE